MDQSQKKNPELKPIFTKIKRILEDFVKIGQSVLEVYRAKIIRKSKTRTKSEKSNTKIPNYILISINIYRVLK